MVMDNFVRVRCLLDVAHAMCSFINKRKRQNLDHDLMLSSALVRQLEIFGEAATGLSKEFRAMYSTVPWKEIIGM